MSLRIPESGSLSVSLRPALSLSLASVLLALPIFLGAAAMTQEPKNPTPWTVDDLILAESSEDWTVSADGSLAAWARVTVETADGKEKRIRRLWLSDLEAPASDNASYPLTRGHDSASSPAFSPDGKYLAFLFDRELPSKDGEDGGGKGSEDAKTQLWVLPLRGGEAYPLTRFDRSVEDFAWKDGETLIVAAKESPSAWERERKKGKDTTMVVDDEAHEPPVRLFKVPLEGHSERLTTNLDWIDSLAVSPDGRRAVVTAQQSLRYDFDQKLPPKTFLVELGTEEGAEESTQASAGGAMAELFDGARYRPQDLRWAPDSNGVYFIDEYTRHPTYRMAAIAKLYYLSLEGSLPTPAAPVPVELDWPAGVGRAYQPTSDGVIVLLADGVRFRPARLTRSGESWQRRNLEGPDIRNVQAWSLSREGQRLVYERSSAAEPPQVFTALLDGTKLTGKRRVTALNEDFKDKPTGRVEVVRWQGAGGDEVEGLLHYPLDWPLDGPLDGPGAAQPPEPRPLILDIHGGPAGADRDAWDQRWSGPLLLFRQRGAFVLQSNYHGSSSYGLDWVESIGEGRYYELEPIDLERGADAIVERGLADPDRLAVYGWSNGGILSAELITRSDRYKAASIGAADVEWFSDWGNVDFGAAFDNYYLGGPPWENVETYLEKSPFFRLTEVTTPTLIHTGTEDRNVPPHQSWSLYRALQFLEKAPTRLVLYPGEPHGLRKIPHQRRKVEEDLAWFDRHLFGREPQERSMAPFAAPKGSPLAALLERQRASRGEHGSGVAALGIDHDGALVPETARFEGLEVGRFEVTRAQLAAFDPAFAVPPGTEDRPATDVSLETAQAYVTWLAERTGRPFRLPTQKEGEALAKAAGTGGNTLNHWAGFRPNPEDAARLHQLLSELPPEASGQAPLLLPVGSLPGTADPRGSGQGDPVSIFDLDGNAAEWATKTDGSGIVLGPSADRAADPRTGRATSDPAYIGLRVVVGPTTSPGDS